MKRCQPITQFLLKLFLVGSSLLFHAFSVSAQSWQQLLSELSETEDFEHTFLGGFEEDAGGMGAASDKPECGYPRGDGAFAFSYPFTGGSIQATFIAMAE